MRIGIDCRLWNETGVGRYIRNLISELVEIDKRNELVLFCLSEDVSSIKYKVSGRNCKVVVADIRWHSVEEQIKFPEILYKENLDLVHFPYFSVPIFYTRPFVITIHDLILHHFPTGFASTLPLPIYWAKQAGYRFVIAQAVKRAKKIIAVSQATKNEIVDHLGVNEKKIVVVYEGTDKQLSTINYKLSNKFENEKYFLYVGNAYPHKNLEFLLESFQRFCQTGQEGVSLVLVGKEDFFYKKLKKHILKLGLAQNVLLFGQASDEELGSLYENALALVYPSRMEGFGLPILEAMSQSCVVLASDIPVFHEIGEDAIIYFNNEDRDGLSEKMQEVVGKQGGFEKYVTRGLKRMKQFSWKKMAQETLAVYNACA